MDISSKKIDLKLLSIAFFIVLIIDFLKIQVLRCLFFKNSLRLRSIRQCISKGS